MSQPTTRCPRCDAPTVDSRKSHTCPHGKRCVRFESATPCRQCLDFKAKQGVLIKSDDTPAKPFVKWAGGKRKLVAAIRERAPEEFGRYFEPFVGGGAIFFGLKPGTATLSDTNERLIRAYRGLRDSPATVISLLEQYPIEKDFFLDLRARPIDQTSDALVAAWLIYLNKTAFNGLYRVNKSGGFNVPWGKYKNPTVCDTANLMRCARDLEGVNLRCDDFRKVVAKAKAGDLVYFDPPYLPVNDGSFTRYTPGGFTLDDHVRLRDTALRLKQAGVHVLLSNSNTKAARELYADGFTIKRISAMGSVAANAESRGKRIDLLVS